MKHQKLIKTFKLAFYLSQKHVKAHFLCKILQTYLMQIQSNLKAHYDALKTHLFACLWNDFL